MEDSASDPTHDKVDDRTYSISFKDMRDLKNKVASLEAELRDTDPIDGYRPPSTVIKTVSEIKKPLDNIEPTGTCFGRAPGYNFSYGRSLVSREFIMDGCTKIFKQVLEEIERLKAKGDIAARLVSDFMEEFEDVYLLEDDLHSPILLYIDEDDDFVYDFGSRVRQEAISILLRNAEGEAMSKLKKKLDGK